MSESMPLLKLVEVGAVLFAGVAFAWWQLRDIKRAQRKTEEERLQASRDASAEQPAARTTPTDDSREAR